MGASLPIFCLGSVVFPGATVGLHVFEDRYRAMVRHLLGVPADDRVFGIVAIREGFEVETASGVERSPVDPLTAPVHSPVCAC